MPIFRGGLMLLAMVLINLPAHARDEHKTLASNLQWTWSCDFPTQLPLPSASQQAFDIYSWQMFTSLSWPVQTGQRGQPDCNKTIGASGITVWQSYKTVDQIFLPDAADPGPWNSRLRRLQINLINIATMKNTRVVGSDDQAVGGWLIDQRGNPTYYTIHANEISYDYIVKNNFYNAAVVGKANNINFPDFATELKASWRILTTADDASRYLTVKAQIAEFDDQGRPTGATTIANLGLVGLHIITKATGYPQWIWSTFEHVDNVPPKANVNDHWIDQPAKDVFYTYFNSKAPAAQVNQSPCNWQRQGQQQVCVPKPGINFKTPNPLSRVTPIATDTQDVNTSAQQSLSQTVFQYYQLITTQRPQIPDNPGNPLGDPTPTLSANVTMESYIQSNSSCMSCHSMATPVNSIYKADFSYLFKFAQLPAVTNNKE